MLLGSNRTPAIALCVAGIAACLLALFSDQLGLGTAPAQSMFGWKQGLLLALGISCTAGGIAILARCSMAEARSGWIYEGSSRLSGAGVPRIVWWITAAFGFILLFYSVLLPTYRGPDEPLHVDLALYVQDDWTYPAFDGRKTGVAIINTLDKVRFGSMSRDLSEDEALPASQRPPLADLTPNPEYVNQLPQHPAFYYYGLALTDTVFDALTPGSFASRPFDQTVSIMRFFNLVLLLPLPLLCFLLARRLEAPPEGAIAASVLPLGIPQLTHIGATVNNDNLLTLLIGVVTLLLVVVARGGLDVRISVVIGILTGIALLTKAFALFLPPLIVVAYLIAGLRRGDLRLATIRALGALLLSTLIGGWWWARNLFSLGEIQPGVSMLPPAPADFSPDFGWWLNVYMTSMTERFWGWFGWFDVRIPVWTIVLMTAVVVVALLAAFLRSRADHDRRLDAALAIVPITALFLFSAVFAYRGYLDSGLTPSMQGRYLFPGIVGLFAVVGLGLSRLFGLWNRFLPVLSLAFVGLSQTVGVLTALEFYWASDGNGIPGRLASMYAWIPWPGLIAIVTGLAGLAVFAVLTHRLARIATASTRLQP